MAEALTSVKKAAAVIIALGAERASEVYKYLNEDEIEQISLEIAKLERLSPEEMQSTVEDFYGLCITQKVINEGGVLYAKDVLEKAFGQQQATSFMERLSKSLRAKSFEFIRKADSKNIQMILQNEHPQTIALILSYARSDQAAQIIAELPRGVQLDVIKRIAELDRVSPEMIKLVEETLEKRFSAIITSDQVEVGGVPYIAEIMNRVDRATEKFIFDELGEKDAALAEEIHKLMFVFEDIAILDSMTALHPGGGYQGPGSGPQVRQRRGQAAHPPKHVLQNAGIGGAGYPVPAQHPYAGRGRGPAEDCWHHKAA